MLASCRRLPVHRSPQGGRETARRGGCGPGRGRGHQAPGPAGGLSVWEMEKVKQSGKGSKTYNYWTGFLARGRQDAQCSPGEHQEDGCQGSPPEGQEDEGEGAGDARVAAELAGAI
jgi:hypothetical protein